ncbi:MAG: ArgK/MeaB family GTPase [Planctomycetota bacterium]
MTVELELSAVVAGVRSGARRELGRALTWIENRHPQTDALLTALRAGNEPRLAKCVRFGITGAPGVGKSSVTARLIVELRARGERVAVLAVDPTSPITGGAVLGDRVRMGGHANDDGVYIRSFASRGAVGGVAVACDEAAELLACAGFTLVLIETVGVGQLELGIVAVADEIHLLVAPDSGDVVQYLKAGLLELVHRIVVNKCDRPGADETVGLLRELAHERGAPEPLAVSANTGAGIEALVQAMGETAATVRQASASDRLTARLERRLIERAEAQWIESGWSRGGGRVRASALAREIATGRRDFADVIAELVRGDQSGGRDRTEH